MTALDYEMKEFTQKDSKQISNMPVTTPSFYTKKKGEGKKKKEEREKPSFLTEEIFYVSVIRDT